MKKPMFLITVLLSVVACSPEKDNQNTSRNIRTVENSLVEFKPGSQSDSTLDQAHFSLPERMALHKIPGASIAVINNDAIEWARGYGVTNVENPLPVTTETIFEAASTTKLLVSVMALHAVEEGLIGLDEDVNNYLKSWKIPENDFVREKKITLRLLLTHQSGLNRPDGGFSWEDGSVPTLLQVLHGEKPAGNDGAFVEFIPGSKLQYSNMGYLVIQMLLEDTYGKPLSQIARELIFEPLSMHSSTLVYPLPEQLRARESMPHNSEGQSCDPVMHPTALAQGGLMTTPSDLALFTIELMKAYQGQSHTILSQEMTRRMLSQEAEIDPAIMGFPLSEGLGVFFRGEGRTLSFLHPGDNYPGATCWLEGFPASGKGIVIMTNGAKGNLLALEILPAFTRVYDLQP